MNDQQKESTAKYMFDVSKGIALLTVIKPLWEKETFWGPVIIGLITAFLFFAWGYTLEGRR